MPTRTKRLRKMRFEDFGGANRKLISPPKDMQLQCLTVPDTLEVYHVVMARPE
jgi:hypothetical protein